MTRFEVYESYLDEEYTRNRAKRLVGRGASSQRAVIGSRSGTYTSSATRARLVKL
jgi:hypothetical protein